MSKNEWQPHEEDLMQTLLDNSPIAHNYASELSPLALIARINELERRVKFLEDMLAEVTDNVLAEMYRRNILR